MDDLVAHARAAQPSECCGVLIGKGDAVIEAVRIRNLAEGLSRYRLDPREHIDARREARKRGLDLLGFYHSHPRSAPEPSATDLAEAAYPDHLYLIVSLREDAAESRLFRISQEGYDEVPYVVSD
jgi:proteasome lid subunit RPN8/RPN11